jgi:mRNA interferase HigB
MNSYAQHAHAFEHPEVTFQPSYRGGCVKVSPKLGANPLSFLSLNGRINTARGKLMKINHWGRARNFIKKHPKSGSPLSTWKEAAIEASWINFADIRNTFNGVDWYKEAIIFDIGGNKFRLIAICRFELGTLYIDKILTHDEYDRGVWKNKYKRRSD